MTSRIHLRNVALTDEARFLVGVRASRALHRPWTTAPCSSRQFRAYVERMREPQNRGFLVWETQSEGLAGVINITNIVLGQLRSGYLGYYAFAGFERRGLMRQGLLAVVRHAFKSLKLHRLEANIQPANAPSIALARSCGFTREGYSPRYLKIGGRWRDHERWAIVAS